jgi:predicted HicB family RNase H-like nuclease
MSTMHVDGYNAKIEYDEELDLFRGEILGLNGGADFYGKNPKELRSEFKKSLQVFLDVCKEKGIDPKRNFSGKFNFRISPELHEQLALAAQAEGKSINMLAQEALQLRVAS